MSLQNCTQAIDNGAYIQHACSDKNPSLWTQALAHFAEQSNTSADAAVALTQALEQIDKRNLLPPLGVVQVLARNSSVTLGTVKDYLIKSIEHEKRLIEEVSSHSPLNVILN